MEELTLDLPSGRVAAVTHGAADGPVVVCVHGLSANARGWNVIAQRLADRGRRVVAYDVRGRGHSDVTPPGSYGLDAHAADVLAVANAVDAEVFDYAGWSMGALIGIRAASLAAGRMRRLVLIDAAGQIDSGARDAVQAGLARLDAVVDSPEQYLEAIRAATVIENWQDQWEAMYRRELREREDGKWVASTWREACQEDFDDAPAHDWVEAWRPLTMPTLLVRATRPLNGGFVVPEDQRDALAATAANVTVAEVDANHFDVMTDPATVEAMEHHLAWDDQGS